MKNIPIKECKYCASTDVGVGWQQGEAIVTFKKNGILGNRLKIIICRQCGAVLYQCVAEPEKYPPVIMEEQNVRR